jgi:putative transposase
MFKGRHFDKSVILLCVRWYLAYNRLRCKVLDRAETDLFLDAIML